MGLRVLVYTVTRDRLKYSQWCFPILREKAGIEFDWIVVDNGSTDGTAEWLCQQEYLKTVVLNEENLGISVASNQAIELADEEDYDLLVKFDNDCEIVSGNILSQIVEAYEDASSRQFGPQYVLSPRVQGLITQPERGRYTMLSGRRIGLTGIVGGLFRVTPMVVFRRGYRFPTDLPKTKYKSDSGFCEWFLQQGGLCGYVEGLEVNHFLTTKGQWEDDPTYHSRKLKEEADDEALEK